MVYGSRALGCHRPGSDLDLTLIDDDISADISADILDRIDAELDDLPLPWMIDLSCLAAIQQPGVLAHIERAGVELYRRLEAPA